MQQVADLLAPLCFFPEDALKARYRLYRNRIKSWALGGAAAIVVLAALPFLWQVWQKNRLQSELASLQDEAAPAREAQQEIRAFGAEPVVYSRRFFACQQQRALLHRFASGHSQFPSIPGMVFRGGRLR